MMNFKRLEKLVRLANNNPNDNEANLAARKVCKMIEEAKFKFIEDTPKTPFQPENIKPNMEDIFDIFFGGRRGQKTWHRPPEYKPPEYNPFTRPFTNEPQKNYDGTPFTESSTKWNKETAPIKVCERCNKEYKSPRILNICADCQWKEEFQKNKNNEEFIKNARKKPKWTDIEW